VNVARLVRDPLIDDQVGEANDRRIFAHLAELGFAELVVFLGRDLEVAVEIPHDAGNCVGHVRFEFVVRSEGVQQVLFDRDHRLDVHPRRHAQFIDDEHVERIRHRDQELLVMTLEGNRAETLRDLGAEEVERLGLRDDIGDVDERNAPDLAEAADPVAFGHEAHRHEDASDRVGPAEFALLVFRKPQLIGTDQALRYKYVTREHRRVGCSTLAGWPDR